MKRYLNLVKDILKNGTEHDNRTGIGTLRVWGRSLSFNLEDGFPLLTTKKMFYKASFVEMIGFIKGIIDVEWYKLRNCNIWNANHEDWHGRQLKDDMKTVMANNDYKLKESILYRVNNPNSLGKIYGYQWRNMNGFDQLDYIYNQLCNKSNSRRLVMSGWNPSEFHLMCLPPCHVLYQFSVRDDYLDISVTQRSVDVGIGLPFNLANTALLCHIMATYAGLKPGLMTWFGNDVHIYKNHVEQLTDQISREPFDLPQVNVCYKGGMPWDIEFEDINVINYKSHGRIKMSMAV